jgi:hypothetical protein
MWDQKFLSLVYQIIYVKVFSGLYIQDVGTMSGDALYRPPKLVCHTIIIFFCGFLITFGL